MARRIRRRTHHAAAPVQDPQDGGMSAPLLISVDFSGRRAPLTLAGTLLLIVGALATTAACVEYRRLEAARDGLELKVTAAKRSAHRDPAQAGRDASFMQEVGHLAQGRTTT